MALPGGGGGGGEAVCHAAKGPSPKNELWLGLGLHNSQDCNRLDPHCDLGRNSL